jgi:hypothetical protein
MYRVTILSLMILCLSSAEAQDTLVTDVLVIGGGTGGTAAGITAARLGAQTIIAESGPWLGGMLSSAGVSATDGNDKLPSGIWQEFRLALEKAYGGKENLATGWVSNTAFEPHVADSIFRSWAVREKNLTLRFGLQLSDVVREGNTVRGAIFKDRLSGEKIFILASQTIDATEQGDALALGKIPYDLGMEDGNMTGESVGVKETNNIVQDLTWVAILKDYGTGIDRTIPVPPGYDPSAFDGSCTDYYFDSSRKKPTNSAEQMLEYGRLPHKKFLLNWPIRGNDTYLNTVEMTPELRDKALDSAKRNTLRFIYFIQHELTFSHLGLADDEFPTSDKLALIPYFRESRRMKGEVRLTMPDIADPFDRPTPLYRTGIAVGDYPIDHHHKKNPLAPQHLDFYPIPSFSLPLGCLIPKGVNGLIAADKNISVSNVTNGTTRLQPVVLLAGQAAGSLAALSIKNRKQASEIPVRAVQEALLAQKAYLLPYLDVPPGNPYFNSIQKVGTTGILRGRGVPYKWENQTWFDPDSLADPKILSLNWKELADIQPFPNDHTVRIKDLIPALRITAKAFRKNNPRLSQGFPTDSNKKASTWVFREMSNWGLAEKDPDRPLTRAEVAVILDRCINIFQLIQVDHLGHLLSE